MLFHTTGIALPNEAWKKSVAAWPGNNFHNISSQTSWNKNMNSQHAWNKDMNN